MFHEPERVSTTCRHLHCLMCHTIICIAAFQDRAKMLGPDVTAKLSTQAVSRGSRHVMSLHKMLCDCVVSSHNLYVSVLCH